MITVDGLTVEFGGTTLFKDISFQINEKDRIALMGKNGAGKSTLLKIIAGVRNATRGTVSAPKDCVIAYLPQHLMTEDGRTVFEETCQAFAHLHEMQAEIDRINNELTTRTDYDSDDYMQLIEKVSSLSEKFYAIDMTHFEEDVEKTLLGLGFERSDFNRPTSEFSGGWRMRIELAKLLLKSPDVLLLDEPTNHLDIESIGWLEDFIINSSKAVVVISHDRKFVDDITTRTIEVTMGRIYDYKATYSQYLELRKERREQQMKKYEEQQKMIAETKDFIERFKGTYSKTFQVQSRVKMLEKLELIEVDEEDTSRLRLKFPPSPRSGAYPVQMSDVAMSFDGKKIFSGVNLTVERGDKIAFVGRNGEGKSTLVKCIMGQLQNEGKLELGHNVQIGYFAIAMPFVNFTWTIIFTFLSGLIIASAFSSIVVYATVLMPDKVGLIAGIFFGLMFGLGGLGSAFFGWLADKTSIEFIFQVSAFLPLLGIIAGFLPNTQKKSVEETDENAK